VAQVCQQTVGNSSDHGQGESSGNDWMARAFGRASDSSDPLTDRPYNYHQDNGGEIMHFYDTRNSF